jgi:VanZ family protein
MVQKLIILAAWTSIAFLSYATLTHVEFVYSIYYKLAPLLMRPEMKAYVHFEHVIAFAILGGLFTFAYPNRLIFVCLVVLVSAGALEYLQTLTPDRHGTLTDAFEKIAGGALGICAVRVVLHLCATQTASPALRDGLGAIFLFDARVA